MKSHYKISLALLTVAASSLAACNLGKKNKNAGDVVFWSSFGSAYSTALQEVCDGVIAETGINITHVQKSSYDDIKKAMDSAIALGDYPNIAMGYPDHFASYLSSDVLHPVEEYFTEDELKDYYPEYMTENKFYDWNSEQKLYAIPFNKSTELLGYNGVFVDYCASLDGNSDLAEIPNTWAEWEVKGPRYDAIFRSLMLQPDPTPEEPTKLAPNSGKKVYGVQNEEGTASGFVVVNDGDPAPEGKKLLLDLTKVDPYTSRLMSWDATDNAFITLVRQWGAEYTSVPESENSRQPHKRYGHVRVNVPANQTKIIQMLKFFNGLNKQHIFGTPTELGGSYSSDAFKNCAVMFMVCSSGGLSYNTALWEHRFRVHPIPYNTADKKFVISQGANICMTDKGNYEESVKVIKAFTTSKFQTEWCLKTGYYPCSKSAAESDEYKAFLAEKTYDSPTRVAYREGSILNSEEYMTASKNWTKFVDPAFDGSSEVRILVKGVLDGVFSLAGDSLDSAYKAKLDQLESADISGNIVFDHE